MIVPILLTCTDLKIHPVHFIIDVKFTGFQGRSKVAKVSPDNVADFCAPEHAGCFRKFSGKVELQPVVKPAAVIFVQIIIHDHTSP